MMKCPYCNSEMKPARTRMSFYNGDVVINPVDGMQCPRCGEETISGEEYERVKRKVEALRKVEKEQGFRKILATL